jgi:hypothetical protein
MYCLPSNKIKYSVPDPVPGRIRIRILPSSCKILKLVTKTLISTVPWLLNDVNEPSKSNKQKIFEKDNNFFVGPDPPIRIRIRIPTKVTDPEY